MAGPKTLETNHSINHYCFTIVIIVCALLVVGPLPCSSFNLYEQNVRYSGELTNSKERALKQTSNHIRILAQSQQSNGFMDTNNPKSNVYLILLIIGICILVVGGIAFCIIFVFRYLAGDRRTGPKVANSSDFQLNVDLISPPIEYSLFEAEIGKPLQDNCVICLEPYMSKSKNKISNHENEEALRISNNVSLTVCGHLLHERCLKSWIQREANCPLCREQFSEENLEGWEQKLKIQFNRLHQLIIEKNIKIENGRNMTKKGKDEGCLQLRKTHQIPYGKQFYQIRDQKYNYDKMVKSLSKGASKPINLRLARISNDNNNFEGDGKNKKLVGIEAAEMYALVIYNAVMNYHETRNRAENIQPLVRLLSQGNVDERIGS